MAEFHRLLARLKSALEPAGVPPVSVHLNPAPAAVPVAPVTQRAELVSRFAREFEAVDGRFLGVLGPAEAAERLSAIARESGAQRAAIGEGVECDPAPLAAALEAAGCTVLRPGGKKDDDRAGVMAELAGCDLGVAEAHYGIAATGTFAVLAAPARPNSLTLLPPVSVVIVHIERLLPDLASVLAALGSERVRTHRLTLITGPSRTADIEKRLVLGAHGPKALYGAVIWPHNE